MPTLPFSHSGEIKSGKFLLEWLSDDENRELVDEIEHVNPAMLDQLVAQSTYLAALFCEYTNSEEQPYSHAHTSLTWTALTQDKILFIYLFF